jgi:hypothetical protein
MKSCCYRVASQKDAKKYPISRLRLQILTFALKREGASKRKEKGARTREGSIESKSLCKGVVVGASEVLCAASAPLATVVYFVHVN